MIYMIDCNFDYAIPGGVPDVTTIECDGTEAKEAKFHLPSFF